MKINKNIIQILALSRKEVSVIENLEDSPVLTSQIQKATKIPRATLDRILIKLHKRNLIGRHKYSRRRGGWVSVPFQSEFREENHSLKAFAIKSFVGLEAMKEAEYDFMNRYKNIKCYGIQSTRAWNAWHTKLSKSTAAELNNFLVQKNILMDVIITKNIDKKILKAAYEGRPSLARVLPDIFLPTAFDIEVTSKEVYIMNWERLVGISIQDEEMALMFQKIIEFIKEGSEYYNIYKALEK